MIIKNAREMVYSISGGGYDYASRVDLLLRESPDKEPKDIVSVRNEPRHVATKGVREA